MQGIGEEHGGTASRWIMGSNNLWFMFAGAAAADNDDDDVGGG